MAASGHSRLEVVHAYVVLPHAVPIIAVMTATAAFAFIARGGWPGGADLLMLLMAMLGGQLAVGATNELVDVELDRVAKPSKPLVSGLATERGARMMIVAGLALMVLGSLRFSLAAFALCSLGTGLGVAYSLWFKRSAWSWIPYILAVPLIPIWVWTALESVPMALVALYPIAIPALVAVQIAQSLPDIEGDATVGVRTLAVALGEQNARAMMVGCVAVSILVAGVIAPLALPRPAFVWAAGLAGAVAMMTLIARWRRDASRARMMAFPVVAGVVAVLGIGWAMGMAG